MSARVLIDCDAYGCCNTLEVHDPDSLASEISFRNWCEDPDNGHFHYCPKCWATIENEQKDELVMSEEDQENE
ncbi:hypothetical protein TW85_20235 [Marinomonas sp. S3726]|uniref:hypothetical protein n=1 Tax=Marinomonas sp. S3726 TaxID=579484 RepID=UPI0005FA0035|nr:hypothetical protein [Marinomonas sp. S3726]KJZ10315.1 hypothetical protein TW85_20235 [Marinomonas sp. S3726]